ncbi:hypothetical protein VKS41_003918 [Umbelopsis sp. WA50703]
MPPASSTDSATGIPDAFIFDESKLAATGNVEKQELYVFQWLSHVEQESKVIDADLLKKIQPKLEKTLLNFITMASPKPRRPIRCLIGRCFILLYTRAETRTLFDTIVALQGTAGAGKNVDKEAKIAAIVTIGNIMGVLGANVLSLFTESANIFLKVIKNSNNLLLMRLESLNAFTLLLKGAGKAAAEPTLKDLHKFLKAGLVDKAQVIRVASAQCLQACLQNAPQNLTLHDIDQMLQALFKALEGSTFPVRRAISTTLSTILAFTQSKATVDPSKPAIKRISTAAPTDASAVPEDVASKESSLLSISQMLSQLSSTYNRISTPREVKAGVIEAYAALFIHLGTSFVETNYAVIVKHLFNDLLGNIRNTINQSDATFLREDLFFLLNDVVGCRLLSEQGQANAIQVLINDWIKTWPALMPNQAPPNKQCLITAVNLVSSLINELGGAVLPVGNILVTPLTTLLAYPSFAVQAATARCLRCVCTAVPANIGGLLGNLFEHLEKDLKNLTNPSATDDLFKRTIGYVYGVAAVMSVYPYKPIYIKFDHSQRAFFLASQLLDNLSKNTKVASVQVQVAWTLISSLMGLGPNIVNLYITKLLLIWKNALPKPTGKESNAIRNEAEWSYILHTKHCVVTSILSFLKHNSKSLNLPETIKRISALLNNTLAFLTTAPLDFAPTTMSACLPYETKLTDQNYQLRQRIFECFVAIRPQSTYESLFSSLLRNSVAVFASPERIIPSSGAQVHVTAAVPGQYVSIWNNADGHGFGVTSKLNGFSVNVAASATDHEQDESRNKSWMTRDRYKKVESQLEQPIMGSLELDPLCIYSTTASLNSKHKPQPVSPSTAYIDASIELFATLFPLQSPPVQESILEQVLKFMKDQKGEKNSPKKMAVLVNVVVALLGAFKNAAAGSKKGAGPSTNIAGGRPAQIAQEILQEAIVHPDPYLRNVASDALGRLVNVVGGSLMSSQIQYLVDLVVNNRDPDARAGCSLALGYIYSHVGGMAAGNHLKTIVGILCSLSSDPHPVVHCWALESLTMTISAASLMFSGYVSSTLGLVAKLYLVETHEPGGGSTAVSNAGMAVGFTAYQEFGRIIYELIGTLGPELQAMSKVRELCINIVEELKLESDERVNMEAIRCTQQFIMFAQSHVNLKLLVPYLQSQLSSFHLPLKKAAVTCLYQLVQRNAQAVFKTANPGLDTELFSMLDTEPSLTDVKDVIRSWLKETAVNEPSVWVNITKQVLTGAVTSASIAKANETRKSVDEINASDGFDDFDDDDEDGFNDEDGNVDITTSVADSSLGPQTAIIANVDIPPRWRTQLFSLICLQECIEIISTNGGREHFDLILARRKRQQAGVGDYLVFRVGDLIKLSFTAATAPVNDLRLVGINLLRTVIEKFATTADPDLEGTLLLEQYAAQIGAALTPAFAADSSSEIVSAAVRVCAVYVGSGIVKDLYQLGRVLKLLTAALEKCKDDADITRVGEIKDISPHASIMVKLSVLNAWAELQVATVHQDYLRQVVQPNLPILSPLWLSSLKDYARIRLESDVLALAAGSEGLKATSSGGIDSMYSAATKEITLPFYRKSWLKIMGAVATLMESRDPSMVRALEEASKEENNNEQDNQGSPLFYVLFGLCIESLARVSSSSGSRSDAVMTLHICLNSLKTFVHPSLAGSNFVPKAVFLELMNVFDRLVQTEGTQVQLEIVQVTDRIVNAYGNKYICDDLDADGLEVSDFEALDRELDPESFPTNAKLYYLYRLLITIIVQKLPALSSRQSQKKKSSQAIDQQTVAVLSVCFDTLGSLVSIAPASYKCDLFAISLYIYSVALRGEEFQQHLAAKSLLSLKNVLERLEPNLPENYILPLCRINNSMIQTLLDDKVQQMIQSEESKDLSKETISVIKHSLLASTLLVTGCPQASIQNEKSIDLYLDTLKQALDSKCSEIALTAHQCLRNLVMLPNKKASIPSAVTLGQTMTKRIIPHIIVPYILSSSNEEIELDTAEKQAAMEEAIKTLLMVHNVTEENKKAVILTVILSTLTSLLDETTADHTSGVHGLVLKHVMALASSNAQMFKEAVGLMAPEVRTKLETCVRNSVMNLQQKQKQQQDQNNIRAHEKEPTIQLKINFGGF